MSILEDIRPRAEHLDEERSARLLQQIVLSPDLRPKRRWRPRTVALTVAGAVVLGGTAYAGGLIPTIVSERFDQMNKGDDAWGRPITHERLIVDTTLSDGTPIRVWRADTPGGACQIEDTTGAQKRPEDFGVTCSVWNTGDQSSPGLGGVLQACEGHPALAFGELRKPWLHVTHARVTADGLGVSLPVDQDTHVFAGEIAAGDEGDTVRIDYLNAAGATVGTDHRTYTVDSDTQSCAG